MARYFDVHPHDPQPRALSQIAAILRDSGVIAYPTDSCYALGCLVGQPRAVARIREIRRLDDHQPLAVVCADMAQLGQPVSMSNRVFRAIRASTPGPYTFILPAARGVPRRLAEPRRRTIGVRIPDSRFVTAVLRELGEPLVSSSLVLPGDDSPMTDGWQIKERLDTVVDGVVDTGELGDAVSTVVDWTGDEPVVIRVGVGDPERFGRRRRPPAWPRSGPPGRPRSHALRSDGGETMRLCMGRRTCRAMRGYRSRPASWCSRSSWGPSR